ncbi:phage tail protein [Escherichia coli]
MIIPINCFTFGNQTSRRLEDFDSLIDVCTTAMLRLNEPEIVDKNIVITIQEKVDYDYIGKINGTCNVKKPDDYKIVMYAYTTQEYLLGETTLNSDGSFYFKRTWAGAKQFRLIKKEDESWVHTLEYPLCIRSYLMPKNADPDVIKVMQDRCYTYDQALAALALMVQNHSAVDEYIKGCAALVNEDGGVNFYVNRLSGRSLRAYFRLGNAAWVLYALAFYLEKYPNGALVDIVRQKLTNGLNWLDRFCVTTSGDLREGLYMGGLGRYVNGVFDADYVAEWCALEHNVDIWFLFELCGRLGFQGYVEKANRLSENLISRMWIEEEGRFRQGVHPEHYDNNSALDQSSWGGIFVANVDHEKAKRCAQYMENFIYHTAETLGYTPYNPDIGDGYTNHSRGVWVEGTAGVALFERKMGNQRKAIELIAALAPLRNRYGYRDSCRDLKYDVLPDWPSTTNTAWIILACRPNGFWKVNCPPLNVGLISY